MNPNTVIPEYLFDVCQHLEIHLYKPHEYQSQLGVWWGYDWSLLIHRGEFLIVNKHYSMIQPQTLENWSHCNTLNLNGLGSAGTEAVYHAQKEEQTMLLTLHGVGKGNVIHALKTGLLVHSNEARTHILWCTIFCSQIIVHSLLPFIKGTVGW